MILNPVFSRMTTSLKYEIIIIMYCLKLYTHPHNIMPYEWIIII